MYEIAKFFSGNVRNYEEITEIVTENLLNWLNLKVTGTVLYSRPVARGLVKCFFHDNWPQQELEGS